MAASVYVLVVSAVLVFARVRMQTAEAARSVEIDFGTVTGSEKQAGDIPPDASGPGSDEQFATAGISDAPAAGPEPVRVVNRRALFPGGAVHGDAASGVPGATSGGASDADADSPVSFSLEGRMPAGEFPVPVYTADEQGTVVVGITVDERGCVTAAEFRAAGSTTRHGELVSAALAAARQTRFTPVADKGLQSGYIAYVFKMK